MAHLKKALSSHGVAEDDDPLLDWLVETPEAVTYLRVAGGEVEEETVNVLCNKLNSFREEAERRREHWDRDKERFEREGGDFPLDDGGPRRRPPPPLSPASRYSAAFVTAIPSWAAANSQAATDVMTSAPQLPLVSR